MKRRAFALPEMVLVIFLLFIGIGLFFVWTERTHCPSIRTQTNNNLKQCALALHNHHDTYRKFAPAFGPGGMYPNQDKSMWFHLLPYVEEDRVYKSPPALVIIAAYNAPADPTNLDQNNALNFAANLRVVAFESLREANQPVNEPGQPLTVPAGQLKSGLTMGRLSDGTSNILMLSTRFSVCGKIQTRYDANVDGSNVGPNIAGGFMGAGSYSTAPGRPGTIDDIFQATPTRSTCLPAPGVFGHSFGTGGMSTALFDGSVKNISPTMSPLTFSRAMCPGDNQELGLDWAED